MSTTKNKAKVCPRVSSALQEDGTSLESQALACIKLAESLGYQVGPDDVLPEAKTAVNLHRPQLDALRRMAAAGEFGALFVYSSDRLSRDPVEMLVLVREFTACGVDVHFVQDPSDDSPYGELVKFVLGFSASQEHAEIRERTMRGRRAVALAGRVPVGSSDGTYGYDYLKATKQRVVNEAEAAVVKRIFRLYVDGWSMYRISKQLNEEGIPTKTGVRWQGASIRDVLSNTSYIGIDYYGKTMQAVGSDGKKRSVPAPRENWIEITGYTEPLVTKELWRKAQERLAAAQERYGDRNKRRQLLTGIAVCGRCGGWVSSNGGEGRHRYYRCNSRHSKYVRGDEEKDCRAPGIRIDWLDDQVCSCVKAMVRNPSGVIADLELNFRTGGGEIGKEIERLRGEVSKTEREEVRLVGLYRRGTIRVELLDAEMEMLTAKLADLRQRLLALEEQRTNEENVVAAAERIRDYCENVSAGLEELGVDGKRALMFRLGIKVSAVQRDVMVTAELDSGFVVNEATTCGCR
ncbi:MAG: recombinase family protein [Chloroflexota bacterium]|nr:recombinase family protein [Chloroflexota bacterium]